MEFIWNISLGCRGKFNYFKGEGFSKQKRLKMGYKCKYGNNEEESNDHGEEPDWE